MPKLRFIKKLSGDNFSTGKVPYIRKIMMGLLAVLLVFSAQTSVFAADIDEIRQMLQEGYYKPVSKQVLEKQTIEEILQELGDPYTEFFSKKEFDDFKKSIDMNYVGIGVLGEQHENGVKVDHLFETGGAIKSDLKVDDIIVEVDGVSLQGKTIDESQQFLLGESGTTAVLKVYRPSTKETLTIKITRVKTEIAPTVESAWLGGNIGFVQLKSFNEDLVTQLKKAIKDLEGVDGWIVDLRDNGGGYLDVAQDVAGFFPNVKAAVVVEGQDKQPRIFLSTKQDTEFSGPVMMLMNSETASAAEILAGAVKDQNAAKLYGQITYGKGLAQSVFRLSSGNMFKMTVAQFYTPEGHVINQIGIAPNVETEIGEELIAAHRDLLLFDGGSGTNDQAGAEKVGQAGTSSNGKNVGQVEAGSNGLNKDPAGTESNDVNIDQAGVVSNAKDQAGTGLRSSIINLSDKSGKFAGPVELNTAFTIKLEKAVAPEQFLKQTKLIKLGDKEVKLGIRPISLTTFQIVPEKQLDSDSSYLLKIDTNSKDYVLEFKTSDQSKVVAQESEMTSFTDVKAGDFFANSVKVLANEGIVKGVAAEKFAPGSYVTREQAAVFFARALRLEENEAEAATLSFKDVRKGDYFYNAVAAMSKAGIMQGNSSTNFGTGAVLTREEMAALLARAFQLQPSQSLQPGSGSKGTITAPFIDIKTSPFTANILTIYQNGIASGTTKDTFSPKKAVTRGEFATFLYRALVNRESGTQPIVQSIE